MNGLYHVVFNTQLGEGAGTVFLKDGEIFGGDVSIGYIGKYEVKSTGELEGTIEAIRHGDGYSVFGPHFSGRIRINVQGRFAGNVFTGIGKAEGVPFTLNFTMQKVVDI